MRAESQNSGVRRADHARQQRSKHTPAATDTHATMEKIMKVCTNVHVYGSLLRLFCEGRLHEATTRELTSYRGTTGGGLSVNN
jgi:hypothetical protein